MDDLSVGEKIVAMILVVSLILGIPTVSTYLEMRTFNRCTGSYASFLDALFSNLRVTECKK